MSVNLNVFEDEISSARFSIYLEEKNNNHADALELYKWNMDISSSFYWLLQHLEVVLRVAINKGLIREYGTHWYNNDMFVDKHELILIKKAKINLLGNSIHKLDYMHNTTIKKFKDTILNDINNWVIPDILVDSLVSNFTFGFWVQLFTSSYDKKIWVPVLDQIFLGRQSRKNVYNSLSDIRKFRNDIAHHQPIFMYNLQAKYEQILYILKSLSVEVYNLSTSTTNIPSLLEKRP